MLLQDLIDLAADDKESLSNVLRKCLIVATELKNEPLQEWTKHELNGYPDGLELPDYRKTRGPALGVFQNPRGAIHNNQPIPSAILEERHRGFAESVNLVQAISAYETMTGGDEGVMSYLWPDNLCLYYQKKLSRGFILMKAWQQVPVNVIAGLLGTVRNRVLIMALEIKATLGTTNDDALQHIPSEKEKIVNQTVINNIGTMVVADHANVNSGQQTSITINWEVLRDELKALNVSGEEASQLTAAVHEDGGTMGYRTMAWIKKNAPKVVKGGVEIGVEVGKAVLTDLIKSSMGIK